MRVLIADDSALIRDGLARLLPAHGFEVAGAVADLPGLLALMPETHPDVALVDIRMPPTHTDEGIAAAGVIRSRFPRTGVIVLSQYVEADYALALLERHPGRCGYLLKDRITEVAVLGDAIRRVSRGETVIDPELVEMLLHRRAVSRRLDELSPREREVLSLLAQGLTDRGIGERLWLTPRTVETHIRHILAKLCLPADSEHNRRVLAVLAYLGASRGADHPVAPPRDRAS